jgi:hypothetical protein
MLRQDEPDVGRVPPPRALPFRYELAWRRHELLWRLRSWRRMIRRLRRHEEIGSILVTCVAAIVAGLLIGHF